MYATFWALVPAVVAIILALVTKEVYSSLFIGVLVGAALNAGFNIEATLQTVFKGGIITQLQDSYYIGILLFLVFLGIMVAMMNKAGGSAAFGRWATEHVKSRVGAQLATILLGILIFIDDYFNCLTVGGVMRPVTDRQKISRAKLAYLIDATAAPICIIAPISSWAAAVAGFAPEGTNGFALFIQAIPYNFYALLTIAMMVLMAILKVDYGPMAVHEANAKKGDLFTVPGQKNEDIEPKGNGTVLDLVFPVVVLIISCLIGLLYAGEFFSGATFIEAWMNTSADVGLTLGSFIALVITIIFYVARKVISFRDCMECVPEGFKAMVPAIIILILAWTLKGMTDSLGAAEYVAGLVDQSREAFMNFLPAIIFLIACFLAFATGTSWGTFGILIPITLKVFPLESGDPLAIICVSACMAGAVCGDHCSPISDTTIMASAGAQCDHVAHVSTQLPYAITVAAISFITYIVAGYVQDWVVPLVTGLCITLVLLLILKFALKGSQPASEPSPEGTENE